MKLGELASRLGAELRGDAELEVTGVKGIEEAGPREITFVANPTHPRYCGKLPHDAVVERIARAAGNLGTNRYYLFKLVEHLDMLGIADGPMHELARRVREVAGEASGG